MYIVCTSYGYILIVFGAADWTAETIAGVGKRYPTMNMAEYAGTLPAPRL
jgi:hypothetical protein